MNDSWCSPTVSSSGKRVSGGAARAVRIAAMGGMDNIIHEVARSTLEKANEKVHEKNRKNIRLVSSN